jgi:hypothetical protein
VLSWPRASGAVQVRYTCARLASRLPDPGSPGRPRQGRRSGFPFVLLQERPANLQPCQLEPHCCDSALPAPAAVVTSEQCKERGADAWIGECTARLGGVALDPSLLVGHWLLSAVYGQRRRRDAPFAPPLFLPMIGHLPDSPDPAPKETGPADRPWCAGLRGLLAARVQGSAHPRLLTGTDQDPARWNAGGLPDRPPTIRTVSSTPRQTAAAAGSDPPAGRPALAPEAFPRRLW